MIGDIVSQNEETSYLEVLLASEQGARLIACYQYGNVCLYRIEWARPDKGTDNAARYDLLEAIDLYRAKIAQYSTTIS